MRLYKRGATWWCSVYEDGQRVQHSTRCRDKKAAEAAARELERRAADPAYAATVGTTLNDVISRLLTERNERVNAGKGSADTVAFYAKKAGHLLRIMGVDFPVAGLTASEVSRYITQRRAEKVSESTISKELVTLRSALKLAQWEGMWTGAIERVLPRAFSPEYRPRERFLTPDELHALLGQLDPDHAARVAFIVATSACWRETERALRSDALPGAKSVLIRGTKRASRHRLVPVVAEWQATLLDHARKHAKGQGGPMFTPIPSIRQHLLWACKRAGIKPCSPNDLRRTCGTWLRAAGAPPHLIAPFMGHTDSRMAETVYAKLTVDQLSARLSAAMGCNTGVTESADSYGKYGQDGDPQKAENPASDDGVSGLTLLPRDGIEPPTRGFSIPVNDWPSPRMFSRNSRRKASTVTPVSQAPARKAVSK